MTIVCEKEPQPLQRIVTLHVNMDIRRLREEVNNAELGDGGMVEIQVLESDEGSAVQTLTIAELCIFAIETGAVVHDCKVVGNPPRHGKLRLTDSGAVLDLPAYF